MKALVQNDVMHLIDGGLSSELERLGARIEGELWTGQTLLADARLVEQAHRNFVAAGAEVVITSSYQLSRQGFEEIGLTASDASKALKKSVEVARIAVANTSAKVAASVGPYGAVLHDGSEYRGDYQVSQQQLEDFHHERIIDLIEAQPDFLAVETIPNVLEAKALANVLREVSLPFWVSFTAGSSTQLWSGEPIEAAAVELAGLNQLIAVGVNCVDPAHVTGLVDAIHSVTGLPAVAYPNCGGVWDSKAGIWLGGSPRPLSDWLTEWEHTQIEWVGGCCGTTADDIRTMRASLATGHNS